jgi:hypothetical protein
MAGDCRRMADASHVQRDVRGGGTGGADHPSEQVCLDRQLGHDSTPDADPLECVGLSSSWVPPSSPNRPCRSAVSATAATTARAAATTARVEVDCQ